MSIRLLQILYIMIALACHRRSAKLSHHFSGATRSAIVTMDKSGHAFMTKILDGPIALLILISKTYL